MSEHTDMSTDASRAIPEQIITTAIQAIRAGAAHVSVGVGSIDGMPIEWVVWIRYINAEGLPDTGATMLSWQLEADNADFQLPERLRDQTAQHEPIEETLEIFATGLRNGWNAAYSLDLCGYDALKRFLAKSDTGMPLQMLRKLEFDALNWSYTGKPRQHLSTRVSLSVWPRENDPSQMGHTIVFTDAPSLGNKRKHTQYETDRTVADPLINQQAPDFRRVAYFDDALDDWVK